MTYAPVGGHEFVTYDDPAYVQNNSYVTRGLSWEGVRWASGFTFEAHNWHPLTWLSHMLDCELFGVHPGRHHQVNVVLHGLNAVLLLAALGTMTRSVWPSAFVAALFALHPLRVESVAWVSERKDVLAALFWMLALLAHASYARRPNRRRYLVLAVTIVLGLMAKPMLVTLPLVLLLLDLWPLRRQEGLRRLVLEKLPLLALAAASSAVTLYVQSASDAIRSEDTIPFAARLVNAATTYLAYLEMTFWPAGLAFFYPHPALLEAAPSRAPVAILAVAVLAVASIPAVRWISRRPYIFVGWAWFLGTLVPVIGLVQVGEQAHADRYAYLPLIGFYIILAWGASELLATRPRAIRNIVCILAIALLAICAVLTRQQVGHWRDSRALYERALAVTRDNYLAHNNLGNLYYRRGELDAAKPHYEAALAARPRYADASYNLGNVFLRQGDPNTAIELYRRALEIRPGHPEANLNIGLLYGRSGDLRRALPHFQRAAAAQPRNPEPLFNIGVVYANMQRPEEARLYLERALRLNPDHRGARMQLQRLQDW